MTLKVYPYPHRYPHQIKDKFQYINEITQLKKENDKFGFEGILLFTSLDDPFDNWNLGDLVALDSKQVPLIACLPIGMHPYFVARKISTMQSIYKRDIAINWITGINKSDYDRLCINVEKNDKYKMLEEFIHIVNELLDGKKLNFDGEYFQLKGLRLPSKPEFKLRNFIAGSSTQCLDLVKKLNYVEHIGIGMEPSFKYASSVKGLGLGIIARQTEQEAINAMNTYFQPSQIADKYIQMSKLNTDSNWKSDLFDRVDESNGIEGFYASVLKAYSQVGFFVSSYEKVANYIGDHLSNGVSTFFVSLASPEEAQHLQKAISLI